MTHAVAKVGGLPIAYEDVGAGPPLVLLRGGADRRIALAGAFLAEAAPAKGK